MKNILIAIVSEGLFSLVALAVLSALVWFGGDYLGYSNTLRIQVILVILAVWFVFYLIQRILAIVRQMRIESMLRRQSASAAVIDSRSAPVDQLTHQFNTGVQALRSTRSGKAAVLQMPWFLVIGLPGSGKTSAIRESGLNFPSVGLGHRANASAGTTRTLDWWYSDSGVFLDTSGSYANDPVRHREWLNLIGLLGQTGRDTPIDGVVLVVSIVDLLGLEEDRLGDHAQVLRDRLDEIAGRLQLVFPVHLIFSHCDRLQGFNEFFAHCSLEERAQVWGCSFEQGDSGEKGLQARVDEEFQRLYQVLGLRRIDALAASANESAGDQQRNALLFPIQFSLLKRRIGHYIAALTRPNPFQESAWLRGFYFTSAVQGGEPIDRVMGSIGLGEVVAQNAQVAEQRSYFLNSPFSEIIPRDQGLARVSERAMRRYRAQRIGLGVAAAGVATAAIIDMFVGYAQATTMLDQLGAVGKRMHSPEAKAKEGSQLPDQLFAGLQAFESRAGIPWGLYPGLLLSSDLSRQVRSTYVTGTGAPLIASAVAGLTHDLTGRLDATERTLAGYEAIDERFRVYLMLCGQIPLDREAVHRLLSANGAETASNLPYLLANFPVADWKAAADPALVERATHELRDALWIPLTAVKIAREGDGLYPVVDMSAFLGERHTSSLTLEHGLPGYFTQRAWDGFVAHAIDDRAQALAKRFAELHIDLDVKAVTARLRARYEEEFQAKWRGLPSMLHITAPRTLDQAIAQLSELGHEGSPYREWVASWLKQKDLHTSMAGEVLGGLLAKDEKNEAKKLEWLDHALNAVGGLQVALSTYASSCPTGTRLARIAELDKAVTACADFARSADSSLASYQEEEPRKAFIAHFHAMAEGARVALEREPLLEALTPAPGLSITIKRADLVHRLESAGVPEFPQRWQEVIAAISITSSENAAAAAGRLANLSSPQSPLALMLRAGWRGQHLQSGLLSSNGAAAGDQEWIETCMKAVGTLSGAYAPAVASEPGAPISRTANLVRLSEAFAASERDIGTALATISDAGFRSAVAQPFKQLQDDARRQLLSLLAQNAEHFWKEQVRLPFLADLAVKFPFVNVAQECDLKVVTAFFGPKNGTLWAASQALDAAAAISIDGKPLLSLDDGYRHAIAAARALRAAMFPNDGEVDNLTFAASLRQRRGVFQEQLSIGAQQLDLHDNPEAQRTFTNTLSEPLMCRISAQVTDGNWLELDSDTRPWGILRWAGTASHEAAPDGRLLMTWTLSAKDVRPGNAATSAAPAKATPAKAGTPAKPGIGDGIQSSWLVELLIDQGPAVGLFSRRIFDDLNFPATIVTRSLE
jgi:type VI secretion system protein ImpL